MPSIIRLPLQVDLKLYEGDDFTFLLTLKNSDGSPTDLTGASARAEIRPTITSTTIAGQLEPTIDELGGLVWLRLTSTVSATLPKSSVWDVELQQADGTITTLAGGTITMTPDVTQ